MTYLVDTDWAIDYLRGVSTVAERIAELAADGQRALRRAGRPLEVIT